MKAYESLGVSAEDYLEAIFVLERQLGAVRSIDVAHWLDVSKPSVCHAMKKLIAGGYLKMDGDHSLHLTEKGRAVAEAIDERHQFFRERLIECGVDPIVADEDACRLEHALCEESFAKLKQALM